MDKKRFKRIYIEITNICNLNCEFCIQSTRKKQTMTTKEFEEVMKKVHNYTDYIYLHIKGEPLMHPNLEEILQIAGKYRMRVNITTNGTLLEQKVDVLKRSKSLRQLNVSLHSVGQNVQIQIDEEEYVLKIIKLANEITNFNGTYISYRIWDMDDMGKDKERMLDIIAKEYGVEDIYAKLQLNHSIKLSDNIFLNTDNVFQWPSMNNDIVSKGGSCYGLISQIGILVDGTVVPCCLDQDGDIVLGNIFEDNMENILNSELAKEIVLGFKNNCLVHPLCQRCGFRVDKRK